MARCSADAVAIGVGCGRRGRRGRRGWGTGTASRSGTLTGRAVLDRGQRRVHRSGERRAQRMLFSASSRPVHTTSHARFGSPATPGWSSSQPARSRYILQQRLGRDPGRLPGRARLGGLRRLEVAAALLPDPCRTPPRWPARGASVSGLASAVTSERTDLGHGRRGELAGAAGRSSRRSRPRPPRPGWRKSNTGSSLRARRPRPCSRAR